MSLARCISATGANSGSIDHYVDCDMGSEIKTYARQECLTDNNNSDVGKHLPRMIECYQTAGASAIMGNVLNILPQGESVRFCNRQRCLDWDILVPSVLYHEVVAVEI